MFALLVASLTTVHVGLREEIVLERPSASAAWAVDANLVDAAVSAGQVTLRGRGVGRTAVEIALFDGIETLEVVVDAPLHAASSARPEAQTEGGSAAVSYESGTGRASLETEGFTGFGQSVVRYHLLGTEAKSDGADAGGFALPNASLSIASKDRAFTLIDAYVDRSRLTADGVWLRGAHYQGNGLELHAGVTSPFVLDQVLLPSRGQLVAGGSYEVRAGRSTIAPELYWFGSDALSGGAGGALAGALYEYRGEGVRVKGEAGFGHEPGAALEVGLRSGTQQLSFDGYVRPQGISSVGLGTPHGALGTALYSGELLRGLTLVAQGSLSQLELPGIEQRSASYASDVRAGGQEGAFVSLGAQGTRVALSGEVDRSVSFPLRFGYEAQHAGVAMQVRWQRNSGTNSGGFGGRLDAHAGAGGFSISAWADLQRDAATVELVFRDDPQLAAAFAQLGLSARTPGDLAAVLASNASLVSLGYLQGATLRLDPWRAQGGLDLAWAAQSHEIRLHTQLDRSAGVAEIDTLALSSLSFMQKLGGGSEIAGSLTYFRSQQGAGWSLGLSLRTNFDGLPRLPWRTGIRGEVVRSDTGKGMPGVRVILDSMHETMTGQDGSFAFEDAISGEHKLRAVLPEAMYFTSQSTVALNGGEQARFSLAPAEARVFGAVLDDAEQGVPGVAVHLARESGTLSATTDSQGRFSFATTAGAATVTLESATLPPGYEPPRFALRPLELASTAPAKIDLRVRGLRSISGRTLGGASVWLEGTNRRTQAGAHGEFALRNLAPGRYTLRSSLGNRELRREITIPAQPIVVHVDVSR